MINDTFDYSFLLESRISNVFGSSKKETWIALKDKITLMRKKLKCLGSGAVMLNKLTREDYT